jgi:hypothetical protein
MPRAALLVRLLDGFRADRGSECGGALCAPVHSGGTLGRFGGPVAVAHASRWMSGNGLESGGAVGVGSDAGPHLASARPASRCYRAGLRIS